MNYSAQNQDNTANKKRIIADNSSIRKPIVEHLRSKGFMALQAEDGTTGLNLLAASIILPAQSMKIKVVVKGVETEKQLEVLRWQGCNYVQGFLCSQPLTAEEIVSFFASPPK